MLVSRLLLMSFHPMLSKGHYDPMTYGSLFTMIGTNQVSGFILLYFFVYQNFQQNIKYIFFYFSDTIITFIN